MKDSGNRTAIVVKAGAMLRNLTVGLSVITTLGLAGCTGTTFTSYPRKINPMISNLQLRQPIDLSQCLLAECLSSDLILYNMERGRLAQLLGNVDASMLDFTASMAKIKENDEKALISAADIGANVAATATNDNAIPYDAAGYERVMLHHYQALNYLNKKDLEGAGVEIRRANAEQEEALKRHAKELDESQNKAQEAQEAQPDNQSGTTELESNYAQLDELAGKVKNSFQNAYTFYLSAFLYEMLQQPNDAYIDYKRALEIYPENSFLQKDTIRLAAKLKMREELTALKARFNVDASAIPATDGDLLVLFEDGFAPQKQEVKFTIPVPAVGLVSAAFPIYNEKWSPTEPLPIDKDGEPLALTEPLCDFRALSVKALKEQAPAIITRQVVRVVAKSLAAKAIKDNAGDGVAGLLTKITVNAYNYFSENADLRSWITLPANAQILRTTLPAGNHKLTLKQNGSLQTTTVDLNVAPGSRTILYVARAGQEFYGSAITFPSGEIAQVVTTKPMPAAAPEMAPAGAPATPVATPVEIPAAVPAATPAAISEATSKAVNTEATAQEKL